MGIEIFLKTTGRSRGFRTKDVEATAPLVIFTSYQGAESVLMPLLQGQPFRLIKPPENVEPETELYTIQHTGEKFISKSDYEDRLALYSQSIWTCQCSGKSGMTHQEAWTSESKVRVLLSSSFPASLWSPILHCIHHSTQPLDQLVETTSTLCLSRFHAGEELTYLNPPEQVRVVSSREAPATSEVENGASPEKPAENAGSSPPTTPQTNGCTTISRDGLSLNGTSNGSAGSDEGSPSSGTKQKDDSPGKKKGLLPLLYDVIVIGQERTIKDVSAKELQRTYKIPPKEHFRLFIRANALRQRSSAFTPWIVTEDLVKQYNIPGKLASVFTQPSFNFSSKKRKLEQSTEKVKKQKGEKTGESHKNKVDSDKVKKEPKDPSVKKEPKDPNAKKKPGDPSVKKDPKDPSVKKDPKDPSVKKDPKDPSVKKDLKDPSVKKDPKDPSVKKDPKDPNVKKDPNASKKKPGPKPGTKRTPKVEPKVEPKPSSPVKVDAPVKMEMSDSDDDISLAVLASKSPKLKKDGDNDISVKSPKIENQSSETTKSSASVGTTPVVKPVKREAERDSKSHKKMKQATLFDMKSKTSGGTGTTPRKSPQKKVWTPESVMRLPAMRRLLHQRKMYKGVRGMGRKIVYTMDQALNRLSLKQIAVIPDLELREEIMKRREKVLEKRILATMSAEDKEAYMKQKSLEEKKKKQESKQEESLKIQEQNMKLEDKIISGLQSLPSPKLVPTPEEIPNSLFGDVTMIVEFIECYREVVLTDKKASISCQHLMQALAAGREGFKFISEIMVLLLHIIIDDERTGDNKELGVKLSELAVHYQTAIELARLCLSKRDVLDSASQLSDDNEFEEESELSDGLLKKLDTHELYELQAEEIIEVLRALCHRAMASYTSLEYYEDFEEKAAILHKQYLQIKKENNRQELQKKKDKRQEQLKKKKEKVTSPKKATVQPRKQANTLESFLKKADNPEKENEEEEAGGAECPDIISVVKRKRMTGEELQREKEEQHKESREKRLVEEEEKRKAQVLIQWEKINLQKDLLARLQPLGVDRNHDRYWLFNCTTPGLYIEKGWVDANTTYCVRSPSPRKESGLEKEKSPKAVAHKLNFTSPVKRTKIPISTSDTPITTTSAVSLISSKVSVTESVVSKSLTVVSSTTVITSSVTLVSSTASTVSSSVTSVSDSCPVVVSSASGNATSVSSDSGASVSASKSVTCSSSDSLATSAISSTVTPVIGLDSIVASSAFGSGTPAASSSVTPSGESSLPRENCVTVPSAAAPVVSSAVVLTSPDAPETSGKPTSSEPEITILSSLPQEMSSHETSVSKKTMSPRIFDLDSNSDEKPLSAVKKQLDLEEDEKPLSAVKMELDESTGKPKGRPRGRPPKPKDPNEVKTPPRPRGRPPKEKTPGEVKTPRPRGRPPKVKTPGEVEGATPGKSPGRPRGRPKINRALNDDETFPPVGQNMWFYYNSLEEVDLLLDSLAVKGIREAKLRAALTHARTQMETNFVKEWQPLEDFVDGSVQLLETLREDIIQIERELTEGWLGSVSNPEEWEKKALEAKSAQELGECLLEAQQHMQIKFLKGIMKPIRKPILSENPDAPQDYEEIEGAAVQHWRVAVTNCLTLSRLHLLVGMFDSCIKWEKSMATKKCKVCRAQDTSVPLATCDKCEGSYHWQCMRPQLYEEPPEPWLCAACQPNKNKERRKITRNQLEEEREEPSSGEFKQEKICRVCIRGIGLIFCSRCPAAYHSECHDPPLQTRARKDWKCVDCQKPRNRGGRNVAAKGKEEVSKKNEPPKKGPKGKNSSTERSKASSSKRSSSSRRTMYTEVEEDEDEEEATEDSTENDDSGDEDFTTRRKSTRARKTVNPPRRTTGRSVRKKSYKIESEEEEEVEEEEEEEEEQQGQESEEEQEEEEEDQQEDEELEEEEEDNEEKEDEVDGEEDEENVEDDDEEEDNEANEEEDNEANEEDDNEANEEEDDNEANEEEDDNEANEEEDDNEPQEEDDDEAHDEEEVQDDEDDYEDDHSEED